TPAARSASAIGGSTVTGCSGGQAVDTLHIDGGAGQLGGGLNLYPITVSQPGSAGPSRLWPTLSAMARENGT
ncbi:MAG: hypothetical protein ACXVGB_10535, partial [Mycobacteriaceae bacterium]